MPPSKQELLVSFVGKTLSEAPIPSAVLDIAKLRTNCRRMLDSVHSLDLGWRAHIKTHKTIELTRLQVDDEATTPVNLVVSTVLEAENIVPLLQEYRSKGRDVNVLYSFPLHTTTVPRLSRISQSLGPNSLSLMVDHLAQLPLVKQLYETAGQAKPLVFLKVDMGYHRAGVQPGHEDTTLLIAALLDLDALGFCSFHGLYAHAGHSYETRDDWAALRMLGDEFAALAAVAAEVTATKEHHQLVLSVGATPTATTLEHPALHPSASASASSDSPTAAAAAAHHEAALKVKAQLAALQSAGYGLEVHAGVYPTLDLQQLATHARSPTAGLSASSIAITILAEIASLYPGRGANGTTEAALTAGSLALGREPCKDLGDVPGMHYSGWGILVPWSASGATAFPNPVPGSDFPAVHAGWQVGRISQEHGILVWKGDREGEKEAPLQVGQRVRVWPNHACIAGAGYDWYLIVDSSRQGKEDEIVDVWPRWRGW